MTHDSIANALRDAGFRATTGRVALLVALSEERNPPSADALVRMLQGKLDMTNTYRSLDAFVEKGLVRRVDVGHQHMHYELGSLAPHKHHFVCANCGVRQSSVV